MSGVLHVLDARGCGSTPRASSVRVRCVPRPHAHRRDAGACKKPSRPRHSRRRPRRSPRAPRTALPDGGLVRVSRGRRTRTPGTAPDAHAWSVGYDNRVRGGARGSLVRGVPTRCRVRDPGTSTDARSRWGVQGGVPADGVAADGRRVPEDGYAFVGTSRRYACAANAPYTAISIDVKAGVVAVGGAVRVPSLSEGVGAGGE